MGNAEGAMALSRTALDLVGYTEALIQDLLRLH